MRQRLAVVRRQELAEIHHVGFNVCGLKAQEQIAKALFSINLLLTMLLCGLWHGASWNFVFWGGLHGVSLAIHRAWMTWAPLSSLENRPTFQFVWTLFSRLLTLGVVFVGWLFFRAQSCTATVFLTHLLVHKDRNWAQEIPERLIPARIVNYAALALLIVCLGASDSAPFIYFRF